MRKAHPKTPFHVLVDLQSPQWSRYSGVRFPWEHTGDEEAEGHVRGVLRAIGEDPAREGLRETPRRYLRFLREFCRYESFRATTFSGEGYDEMIVVSNIPFFSLCEHHMVPFFGTAAVGYIPGSKIVGLSKLARAVELYSRRLQNQERITTQVADHLESAVRPRGVGVVLRARHLCMEMRGVRKHDTWTTTSIMRGLFEESKETRSEFLTFLRSPTHG